MSMLRVVSTLEVDPEASKVARETFARTGTDGYIEPIEGDAHERSTCPSEITDHS